MIRRRIVRTLLYKEALRYRYNWGLLVMVVALLALAALVSISARLGKLPGQGGQVIENCFVAYNSGDERSRQWADYLRQSPLPQGLAVRFLDVRDHARQDEAPRVPLDSMVIRLRPPGSDQGDGWKVRYYYA